MALDVTDIAAAFNKTKSTVELKLKSAVLTTDNQYSILRFAKKVPGIINAYIPSNMLLTELTAPFTSTWGAKGDLLIKPQPIPVRPIKVNFPFTVDDFRGTYLAAKNDDTKAPNEQQIVTEVANLIAQKVVQERDLIYIGKGVYNAVGTTAVSNLDGIVTQMTAGVGAGGRMYKVPTPAITSSNAFDVVNQFALAIPKLAAPMCQIFCDHQTYQEYMILKRAEEGTMVDYSKDDVTVFPTNMKLYPLDCLTGTRTLFATIKDNLIMPYNTAGRYMAQVQDYTVKMFWDFTEGIGFGIHEFVFVRVNEGAGVNAGFGADTVKYFPA